MLSRRQFFSQCAAAAIATIFTSQLTSAATTPAVIKPQKLRPGTGVGLISPASAAFQREQLDIVVDAVEALGLVPHLAPHILDRYGYLAGKDRDRAADVNQFFADPKIEALLPLQGGWGSSRILPYLDYDTIRQNPKIIVGFSDITALLLGIYAQTGLVTFHGPHGLTGWRTPQTDFFRRVLFAGDAVLYQNQSVSADANRLMQTKYRLHTIKPGRATGKLIGGNLSVLSAIVGSPYLPNLEGAILFLEDINENIYRIDRMLTQLKLAGVLEGLAGFIFGQCSQCSPGEGYGSLTLEEVLADHITELNIPSWSGAQIGHVETIWTLPIGINVEIDANLGTIRFLESAVA
jgi:muramoyltetrapeptide carboxypeptidase